MLLRPPLRLPAVPRMLVSVALAPSTKLMRTLASGMEVRTPLMMHWASLERRPTLMAEDTVLLREDSSG